MLQKYDRLLPALALALAALTGQANAATGGADVRCTLTDGLAVDVAGYLAEAEACLGAHAADAETIETEMRLALFGDRQRAKLNLPPLARRVSLDQAARLHALDMAARGYAAHASPEGLSHLDRVRRLDRRAIIGAFGANVAIAEPGDAIALFAALMQDPANAENLGREAFTDTGLAMVEADGRVILVQLFAQVDGTLETPLPARLEGPVSLSARWSQDAMAATGWSLSAPDGRQLERGFGEQLYPDAAGLARAVGIEAELGLQRLTLKAPATDITGSGRP